jgi:hypothetical protein
MAVSTYTMSFHSTLYGNQTIGSRYHASEGIILAVFITAAQFQVSVSTYGSYLQLFAVRGPLKSSMRLMASVILYTMRPVLLADWLRMIKSGFSALTRQSYQLLAMVYGHSSL